MAEPLVRRLTAIMFTDVAGYSRLMSTDEARALAVLKHQRELFSALIAAHKGTLHKEIGDGTLSSFGSAVDALQCASAIQQALAQLPEHDAFSVRIGLHIGDVVFQGEDVFGDGVNVASRIEALAPPAGIALSGQFHSAVRSQSGFSAYSLGDQQLKGLDQPVEVFVLGEAPAAPSVGPRPRPVRWVMAGAAGVLVLALGWVIAERTGPAVVPAPVASAEAAKPALPSAEVDKSIAVLPFMNMSGDAEQEFFSDGITEELLNHLAQVSELRVTARTSSFAFKGKQMPVPEIAAALGVAHVLEGSVRRAGNTVRITAQLIRAADGSHLWSQTYDRPLDDIFRVQDEISAAVTRELKARLLHPSGDRGGVDPKAYELYLQAKQGLDRRRPDALEQAEALLVQATTLAPGFVDAWSQLAITRFQMAGRGDYFGLEARVGTQQSLMAGAREAANRALAIDPSHAATHARLAAIDRRELGLEVAAAHIRRALELNDADPEVRFRSIEALAYLGRSDQAIALERIMVERDPMNDVVWLGLAGDLETEGRLEESEAAFRKAIALNPEAAYQRAYFGLVLARAGKMEEAAREIAAEREGSMRLWAQALFELVRNNRKESDEALQQLVDGYADTMAFQIAEVYACRGEGDAAFEWLDKARQLEDLGLDLAHLSFCLGKLNADPRWLPFLRQIGRDPERLARIPLEVKPPAAG